MRLLLSIAVLAASSARAEEVRVGVAATLATDLPDPVSGEYARFGPGPGVQVPVWVELAPWALLRATVRGDLGVGSDRVSWKREIDGEPVRFYDDEQFAMFVAGGLTLGPEVVFPTKGSVEPYLGAEAGGTWVGTYHAFDGPTALLLAPERNGPKAGGVDPYTSQLTVLTEVHMGLGLGTQGRYWTELGYSVAWVGASDLRNAPDALAARRAPWGWNAIRLALGVRFGR